MIIYFIIFFLLISLSTYEFGYNTLRTNQTQFYSNFLFKFTFIILFLFAGLRGANFGDYCAYWNIFEIIPSTYDYFVRDRTIPRDVSTEFAFNFFFPMFVKNFTSNHVYYFLLTSFAALVINFYAIRKMSPFFFLSLLIYFSHIFLYKELQQMRSGISGALVLLSVYFLSEKKTYSYLTVFFSAFLIHTTAFVSFFGVLGKLFFSNLKKKKIFLFLILILVILSTYLGLPQAVTTLLENSFKLPIKYYIYRDSTGISNNYQIGIFSNITTLKYIFFSIVSILFYDTLNQKSKYFKYSFYFYYVGTLWIIFFNHFAIIATRMASILTTTEIILVPLFIFILKKRLHVFLLIILFSFTQLFYNLNYSNNVPKYKFIFENIGRSKLLDLNGLSIKNIVNKIKLILK